MARLRGIFRGGPASALLIMLMLAGCLLLWVGIPVGWLWVGSQVESSSSLAAGLGVTMAGILVSIALTLGALGWLNRRHAAIQEGRHGYAGNALEVILVSSALIAILLFTIWFLGFAGTSPLPVTSG